METTQQELKAFYDLLDSPDDKNKKLALELYKTVNLKPHEVIKYILLSGKGWAYVDKNYLKKVIFQLEKKFLKLHFLLNIRIDGNCKKSNLIIKVNECRSFRIDLKFDSLNTSFCYNVMDIIFFDLKNLIYNETTKN